MKLSHARVQYPNNPGLWILQITDRQNVQGGLFYTGCFCYSLFFCQYFPYKLLLFVGLAGSHKILLLAGTWQTVSQVGKIILNKILKYMKYIGALLKARGAVIFIFIFFWEKVLVAVFFTLNPLNKFLP